ncbi:topoisomerase DNA-binding C4 zinc finger domain-containing protein [Pseudomonas tremae]|uniref:topoisomerase DNA-binding C4 zinc finger domain-containing protein n=1 Tax=Pseudomonas tremae TaxID=200454 RepID=UPI001F3ED4BA|nr:topoisomerase DNA-binding C4 zinc finger domain-containing protein [Pseudomonas tremae]MCF5713077.1 topoisomerase [Pseudomonas tremae]UQB33029.1 topoisomerase DNA-binding C4 zinc finger domain-containing protein [Pseudomonas tremae]
MKRDTTSALAGLIRKLRDLLRGPETPATREPHHQPDTPDVEPTRSAKPVDAAPAQRIHKTPRAPDAAKPASAPSCPHCKKIMVIKVARTGKNAGEFWGCVAYPKCRGIRPIFR